MLDTLIRLFRASPPPETTEQRSHRLDLIETMTFEIIPLKSVDAAIEALPPRSRVSVTASPAKGLDATREIAERLLGRGHLTIPHISARMVRDRAHTRAIGSWIRESGITTMFLVGGDMAEPGDYPDAVSFLDDLLETDHRLERIGVTAYPDGHPIIDTQRLHEALHRKQQMLSEAGIDSYCATQMCFDAKRISNWLHSERAAGLELPVHLGVAGLVERTKLLTMGVRLGVGQSLSYLRKNRRAITTVMTSARYDPNHLLEELSPELRELGVTGLHVFTFNQVESTAAWRAKLVG